MMGVMNDPAVSVCLRLSGLAWVAGGLPEILYGKDDFAKEFFAATLASLLTTNIDQTCAEHESVKYFQRFLNCNQPNTRRKNCQIQPR